MSRCQHEDHEVGGNLFAQKPFGEYTRPTWQGMDVVRHGTRSDPRRRTTHPGVLLRMTFTT